MNIDKIFIFEVQDDIQQRSVIKAIKTFQCSTRKFIIITPSTQYNWFRDLFYQITWMKLPWV